LYIDAVDQSSYFQYKEFNFLVNNSNIDEGGTACVSNEEIVVNCLENQEDTDIPLNTGKFVNCTNYGI